MKRGISSPAERLSAFQEGLCTPWNWLRNLHVLGRNYNSHLARGTKNSNESEMLISWSLIFICILFRSLKKLTYDSSFITSVREWSYFQTFLKRLSFFFHRRVSKHVVCFTSTKFKAHSVLSVTVSGSQEKQLIFSSKRKAFSAGDLPSV